MSNAIIEATRIQARAVIPIVRALEAELGKERAHEIVGRALADNHVAWMEKRGVTPGDDPRAPDASPDYPTEKEVVEDSADAYGHNITACAFAELFRRMGEPEVGALMCCGVDFATEARFRPGWDFSRTQTLMQGAGCCDFRWRRKTA